MEHTKSQAAFEEARQYIPGGVNSPVRSFRSVGGVPPFISGGKGSKIYDIDGNEYIDYVMSYGPLLMGHVPDCVTDAIKAAAESHRADMTRFLRAMISHPSESCEEGEVVACIKAEMESLGYVWTPPTPKHKFVKRYQARTRGVE